VPLTSALRPPGTLAFDSPQVNAYRETDLDFLEQVGRQVAVGLDNALHDQEAALIAEQFRRERDRMQLLLEVNNSLVTMLDLQQLFKATAAKLRVY
jgi:formate hydrogenlyase transcriptional activator